jgi:hypothetical protein
MPSWKKGILSRILDFFQDMLSRAKFDADLEARIFCPVAVGSRRLVRIADLGNRGRRHARLPAALLLALGGVCAAVHVAVIDLEPVRRAIGTSQHGPELFGWRGFEMS